MTEQKITIGAKNMPSTEEISKDVEQLKKDLQSLRGDIGSLANTLKDAGLDQGRAAYERVKKEGDDLRHRGEDALGAVAAKIDERPVASALTAFGSGFVIGLLLNQKRS
jgi:ElaB/YqjD/DUF883 family membrane-anchored ribosome-binding protein